MKLFRTALVACPDGRLRAMRIRPMIAASVVGLAITSVAANAQSYRGQAATVIRRREPVEFSRMRLLTFAFGREGPMDTPLSTPPVAGREYFVEADIFS